MANRLMYAVIQYTYGVFGVGSTAAEAVADAKAWSSPEHITTYVKGMGLFKGEFYLMRCSPELAAEVTRRDGRVAVDLEGGVLVLANARVR
jgi:hypothetical protein